MPVVIDDKIFVLFSLIRFSSLVFIFFPLGDHTKLIFLYLSILLFDQNPSKILIGSSPAQTYYYLPLATVFLSICLSVILNHEYYFISTHYTRALSVHLWIKINLVTREQTLQIASSVECLDYLSPKSPSIILLVFKMCMRKYFDTKI